MGTGRRKLPSLSARLLPAALLDVLALSPSLLLLLAAAAAAAEARTRSATLHGGGIWRSPLSRAPIGAKAPFASAISRL